MDCNLNAQNSSERFPTTDCISEYAVIELTLLQRSGILISYETVMVSSKKKAPGHSHKLYYDPLVACVSYYVGHINMWLILKVKIL